MRAVVIDSDDRILLVRFEFPDGALRWAAPGGGIEPDEDVMAALRRELREELGLTSPQIGPEVWTRTHIVPFVNGLWDGQSERFFLIETERFDPTPTVSDEELAAEFVTGMRWWTIEELHAANVTFAPARLPELVASLIKNGPPPRPIDTGV